MPLLTVSDDNGRITCQVTIRNLDPSDTITAILAALKPLKEIPPPRKRRSDAGKPKKKSEPTPA